MDGIEKLVTSESDAIQWFDNGTYQGVTSRGYDTIIVSDTEERIAVVFKKLTGEFSTTCRLDDDEHTELLETGNFGGGKDWFSSIAKNISKKNATTNSNSA